MIKKIITMLFLFGFLSCNNSNSKLIELEQENEGLKKEIKLLKTQIIEYNYMPIICPKSSKIKLGEKYETMIFIGAFINDNEPIGIIKQNIPGITDTFIYNKERHGFIYTTTPNSKGQYKYAGIIEVPTSTEVLKMTFLSSFEVE